MGEAAKGVLGRLDGLERVKLCTRGKRLVRCCALACCQPHQMILNLPAC